VIKCGSVIARRRINSRLWNANIHNFPASKSSKANQPSERKLTLTLFWDSHGPVLEQYQERDTTINRAWYSEIGITLESTGFFTSSIIQDSKEH
jgi:hypothetical protein